jgi:hypothetical protein
MIFSPNLIDKTSYTIKGKSSWSGGAIDYCFSSSVVPVQKSFSSQSIDALAEIQQLVQELAKLENIRRVRAVAPKAPDLHIIDFEVELQPKTELAAEAWDKIQDLVIDSEWKLRDNSHQKWYFHAEVVEAFSKLKARAEVVAEHPIQRLESLRTTFSSFSATTIQTKRYSSV